MFRLLSALAFLPLLGCTAAQMPAVITVPLESDEEQRAWCTEPPPRSEVIAPDDPVDDMIRQHMRSSERYFDEGYDGYVCAGSFCPRGAEELLRAALVVLRHCHLSGEACMVTQVIRSYLVQSHPDDEVSRRLSQIEPYMIRICP